MARSSAEPPTDDDGPIIRPFSEWLIAQSNGMTHAELTAALHEVVSAVKERGKAGKIQLTIDVKPMSKSDDRAMILTASVVSKPPKGDPAASVFFTDDDGNLQRDDPRQMRLPLREVADKRAGQELKEAGSK